MSESFELKKKRPSCAPSKSPTALLEGRKRGEPGHDKMGIDRSEGNGDNVQDVKKLNAPGPRIVCGIGTCTPCTSDPEHQDD